jgi:hypothetical protein
MQGLVSFLIPFFIMATTAVLLVGITALFIGGRFNRSWSNRLMRLRVLLQFIAVCLIAAAAYFFSA